MFARQKIIVNQIDLEYFSLSCSVSKSAFSCKNVYNSDGGFDYIKLNIPSNKLSIKEEGTDNCIIIRKKYRNINTPLIDYPA